MTHTDTALYKRMVLAETLRKTLVAAGVIRSDADPNGAELLMAAEDFILLAQDNSQPESAEWFQELGAVQQECCRPKHGKRVDELGGFNSWEWEYVPALKLPLGESRLYKQYEIEHKVLPGYLYRWADRPTYWLVLPDGHPLQGPHEVLLPRQPKTRGDVRRLVASLTPEDDS